MKTLTTEPGESSVRFNVLRKGLQAIIVAHPRGLYGDFESARAAAFAHLEEVFERLEIVFEDLTACQDYEDYCRLQSRREREGATAASC